MSGGYLSGGICPVGICPVGICPDTNFFNVFPAKDMYRAAPVKNNEKILALYFKLSQYVIHIVQNNTAINIATAVKWMAINEDCLIWGI